MNRREFCKNTFLAALSATCAGGLLANVPETPEVDEEVLINLCRKMQAGQVESQTPFHGYRKGDKFVDQETGRVWVYDGVCFVYTSPFYKVPDHG